VRGLCKDDHVVLAVEITSAARVNVEAVAREAINEIRYNDPNRRFNAAGVSVLNLFSRQAAGIACGVDNGNDVGADGRLRRPERR
jgi:S-adenosylmethionine synthetase